MKEVRKKSADAAVNQMLIKAYRQHTELSWDRAEAMQPQCGFGRLAICCTDCFEGPCRVNPFEEGGKTICGRDREAMVRNYTLTKAADGARALLSLAAEFGAPIDGDTWQSVSRTSDKMLDCGCFAKLGDTAVKALTAIKGIKTEVYGNYQPGPATVNMGVLQNDCANIVLHGHVVPAAVKAIAKAAKAASANVVSLCGSELSGFGIGVVTNYDSQETPLLTGAVDLLVLGSQCVTPALLALAARQGIPVVYSRTVTDEAAAEQAVASALKAYKERAGKQADIPAVKADVYGGYTAQNSSQVVQMAAKAYAQGTLRGVVYIGGCGTVAHTQDAGIQKVAASLVDQGYLIISGGCAGTALAKAGMCSTEGTSPVAGLPAVLNLGSCHDAGAFLTLAREFGLSGIPAFAVMPELAHNKTFATAIGFAAAGITTFVDTAEIILPKGILDGRILPLAEFEQLPQALAEVAAAK